MNIKDEFDAARNGSLIPLQHFDVDLSIERTQRGCHYEILGGDSFMIDQDPDGGEMMVAFQDVGRQLSVTFVSCSPGTIYKNIPFTQIQIVNPAQPGKKLRILYGVGLDFTPGVTQHAQVTISGNTPSTPLYVTPPDGVFTVAPSTGETLPVSVKTELKPIKGNEYDVDFSIGADPMVISASGLDFMEFFNHPSSNGHLVLGLATPDSGVNVLAAYLAPGERYKFDRLDNSGVEVTGVGGIGPHVRYSVFFRESSV